MKPALNVCSQRLHSEDYGVSRGEESFLPDTSAFVAGEGGDGGGGSAKIGTDSTLKDAPRNAHHVLILDISGQESLLNTECDHNTSHMIPCTRYKSSLQLPLLYSIAVKQSKTDEVASNSCSASKMWRELIVSQGVDCADDCYLCNELNQVHSMI